MIKAEYGAVKCVKNKTAEVKVATESPLAINEDVKKIISVNATAFVTDVENKDETTRAKAKVAFTVVYLAEDGFKKTEVFAEAEAELPVKNAFVCAEAVDARVVNVNENYVARCGVKFIAQGCVTESKDVLAGGDGILIKEREIATDEQTETSCEDFSVTDEFEVNYAVKEVLGRNEFIRVKSVESGVSRVIFEGDVELTVKVLPFSENNDIIKEKRSIPFRFELPVVGALPDARAFGDVRLCTESVKVFTDEAKNKSSISAEITLTAFGFAIGEVKTVVAEDAYSREDETETTKTSVTLIRYDGRRYREERIVGKTNAKAPDGSRIIGMLGECVNLFPSVISDDKTTVNGTVRADVAFRNSDNGTTCVQVETPFSLDIVEACRVGLVKVTLESADARVRGGEIELECVLALSYVCLIEETISCIADVTSLGARKTADSAITVFIPTAGDELWDVSKRLAASAEEITALNPDLVFPLKGDERIIVYRQKI